mmetsp:Transcript_106175/g.342486  ORF Transcript_106175/g.342486 Transcript_106175/m.342486 type:complete len:217 (-) Transcript_106175:169-819(-)
MAAVRSRASVASAARWASRAGGTPTSTTSSARSAGRRSWPSRVRACPRSRPRVSCRGISSSPRRGRTAKASGRRAASRSCRSAGTGTWACASSPQPRPLRTRRSCRGRRQLSSWASKCWSWACRRGQSTTGGGGRSSASTRRPGSTSSGRRAAPSSQSSSQRTSGPCPAAPARRPRRRQRPPGRPPPRASCPLAGARRGTAARAGSTTGPLTTARR